jgi:hypothetical protein
MKRNALMIRSVLCAALGIAFVVCWLPAPILNAADDPALLTNLTGRWVYVGDDAERQARLDAIEATVSQMAWIARGIARKRITASTPIHDQYIFTVDEGTITIAEDDFPGFTTPWGGTEVEIPKDKGGPAVLTRQFEEAGLRSHWQAKKGAGTEIYSVAPDGATMTVTVVISSPRLPLDVRYELTYSKTSVVSE